MAPRAQSIEQARRDPRRPKDLASPVPLAHEQATRPELARPLVGGCVGHPEGTRDVPDSHPRRRSTTARVRQAKEHRGENVRLERGPGDRTKAELWRVIEDPADGAHGFGIASVCQRPQAAKRGSAPARRLASSEGKSRETRKSGCDRVSGSHRAMAASSDVWPSLRSFAHDRRAPSTAEDSRALSSARARWRSVASAARRRPFTNA
jgi:hypothetical protein